MNEPKKLDIGRIADLDTRVANAGAIGGNGVAVTDYIVAMVILIEETQG